MKSLLCSAAVIPCAATMGAVTRVWSSGLLSSGWISVDFHTARVQPGEGHWVPCVQTICTSLHRQAGLHGRIPVVALSATVQPFRLPLCGCLVCTPACLQHSSPWPFVRQWKGHPCVRPQAWLVCFAPVLLGLKYLVWCNGGGKHWESSCYQQAAVNILVLAWCQTGNVGLLSGATWRQMCNEKGQVNQN